jgi:hypothetical protein
MIVVTEYFIFYCQRMPRCSLNPFKTITTPPLVFIEVIIPSQESDRECIRSKDRFIVCTFVHFMSMGEILRNKTTISH